MNAFLMRRRATSGNGLLVSAALLSAAFAAPVSAATDGTLGATSSGSVAITASVPNRARISNLVDIDFTNQDPASAASDAQNVCVWSNTATKAYTITASGSGDSSAFTLTDGTATVPYSVAWAAASGATSGTALSAGTASGSFTSTATNHACASGPAATASLVVGMTSADLSTMSAGVDYTGTLTLLVTPL